MLCLTSAPFLRPRKNFTFFVYIKTLTYDAGSLFAVPGLPQRRRRIQRGKDAYDEGVCRRPRKQSLPAETADKGALLLGLLHLDPTIRTNHSFVTVSPLFSLTDGAAGRTEQAGQGRG